MFLNKIASLISPIKWNSNLGCELALFRKHVFNIKPFITFYPKTYYAVLGVKPESTDEEIKEAYYSLSKKYHPDLNIGNKTAEIKIVEINEAFETLGNKAKKEEYDDKVFPKIWEKQPFIYDHKPPAEENFIFRRTPKWMPNSYDQYLKHCKGVRKRNIHHARQKNIFNKSQSSQKLSKTLFKK